MLLHNIDVTQKNDSHIESAPRNFIYIFNEVNDK